MKRPRGVCYLVIRTSTRTRTGFQSTWMAVDRPDTRREAPDFALSLLTDPHDTIIRVHVWDNRREQFTACYKGT